jgi:hypothetical protein
MKKISHLIERLAVAALIAAAAFSAAAQGKEAVDVASNAVLWEPVNIVERDLFNGPRNTGSRMQVGRSGWRNSAGRHSRKQLLYEFYTV